MGRLAIATLSADTLLHNLELIRKQANNRKIIAMIKSNAYGHSLRSVAMRLDNKVYSFGVVSIDEALALRKVNVQNSITLMSGAFEANDMAFLTNYRQDY